MARFTDTTRKVKGLEGTAGTIRLTIADDSAAGGKGLDRVFVGLGAVAAAMPGALQAALPEIRAGHAQVFATEGAAGRGRWAPLAPATIVDRRRKGFGSGPILVRTGALRAHVLSAPARTSRTGGGYELRIKPGNVVAGRPKYGPLARGTGNMPGRPMVVLGPAAANRVTSAISRYLRQRVAANGL